MLILKTLLTGKLDNVNLRT